MAGGPSPASSWYRAPHPAYDANARCSPRRPCRQTLLVTRHCPLEMRSRSSWCAGARGTHAWLPPARSAARVHTQQCASRARPPGAAKNGPHCRPCDRRAPRRGAAGNCRPANRSVDQPRAAAAARTPAPATGSRSGAVWRATPPPDRGASCTRGAPTLGQAVVPLGRV